MIVTTIILVTIIVVRLHQLITSRYEPELVAGRATRVWARSANLVSRWIYGPHFEDMARRWCVNYAADDVAAASRVAAIGEAKATGDMVGVAELRRLEHLRGLLPSARIDRQPKLLIFSRMGFSSELTQIAFKRPDVEPIGMDRMYHGC